MMWKMLMQLSVGMKLKPMLVLLVTLSASRTGRACPFARRVTGSTMHLYKEKAIFMDKRNWVSGWYFLSCPTQGLSNCPLFYFLSSPFPLPMLCLCLSFSSSSSSSPSSSPSPSCTVQCMQNRQSCVLFTLDAFCILDDWCLSHPKC